MRSRLLTSFALIIAALSVFVLLWAFPSLMARAATGTLSSLAQTVVSDGTAPFDSLAGNGRDTGATNGIVRTRDTFTLSWSFVVSVAGDVTFTQTLVNARWDQSSAGSCSQGVNAISADQRTITCTLTNLTVGSGSYPLRAVADGGAPNGAAITGEVSAGSVQSAPLALTVSATPNMNIGTMDLFPIVSNGPGSFSSTTGYYFDVPVAMWADVVGVFDGFSGLKGIESVASPLTFSAVPSSSAALLVSCSAGAAGGTRPALPDPSGGNGRTVLNATRNSGSWSCSQSAAGAPVSVTVTGADTSLNSYPTKSANNSTIANNKAYFAVGYVRMWVPKSATNPNTTTTFSTRITQFDPISVSGTSNLEAAFAPNQPDPGTCVSGAYANCSAVVVNRVPQAVRPDVRVSDANLGPLPGSSVSWDGLGQVTAGTKYYASILSSVPIANDTMTNITMCLKWNPSQSSLDASKPILTATSPTGANATIEYGTRVYSSLSEYQAADCGRPGTGAQWFSSISAAGGAASVTAVRITFNAALNAGASLSADVPLIAGSGLTAGEVSGYFGTLSSQETSPLASSYNPTSATGLSGTRVTHLDARTGVSIAWDTATSSLPAVREIAVTPRLLAGQTAKDTKVFVTLPSACFDYVPGSASISPASLTPAQLGQDGIACTGDDGTPAVLEFAYGDMTATPEPITFRTNISPRTAVPSNHTVQATISSPSDPASSSAHSASATLSVSAVAGFSVAKTADTGRVTEGTPFNYVITWRNGSASQSGGAKVVDVMPFPGDSRGSSGFSALAVNSVTAPVGAVVEYSALDPATALALAEAHPDGEHSLFQWTTSKPHTVTAIRLVIANIATNTSGSAQVNVAAVGVEAGGTVNNDLYGVASFAPTPIRAAVPLEIQTLGTTSLTVTQTANLGEITAAGQSLRYSIRVTNTGQEALSSVSVSDHDFTGTGLAPTVSCPSMVLAAGASVECHTSAYIVPQADLDSLEQISNAVTAVGTTPSGSTVSATDTVSTPVRARSDLTLTQIPSPNNLSFAGSTVTYSLTATNSGTRTLSNLSVHSGAFNGSAALAILNCPTATLAPNASVTCTTSYAVTQADLDGLTALIHQATASATDTSNTTVHSNRTQTTVPLIRTPGVSLSKTAEVASFGAVGDSIPFAFTITNTGNVTLNGAGVTEVTFSGSGTLGAISCPQTSLAPGDSLSCSASYLATQSDLNAGAVTNVAKAFALFNSSRVESSESSITVPARGINPGISISTSSDREFVSRAAEEVNYTFVLTNTGNVTLTGIAPEIPTAGFNGHAGLTAGDISCPSASLDPRASMTCTARYIVTQRDIDALANVTLDSAVRASAGATVVTAAADQVVVDIDPVAHLDVAATASRSATTQAGDTILFTLTLVNDGAVTLTNVTAAVAANGFNGTGSLGAIACPPSLALTPGQSATCTVSYTVNQADIDELDELRLTADAAGMFAGSSFETRFLREANDTAQVFISPRENLSVVKSASLAELSAAGTEIDYEFLIINSGTTTLFDVRVQELNFTGRAPLSAVLCPSDLSVLAPGESARCRVTYVASDADLFSSTIRNTAVASGVTSLNSRSRPVTSPESTAVIAVNTQGSFSSAGSEGKLTLTGAARSAQLIAASLALILGTGAMISARRWRRS